MLDILFRYIPEQIDGTFLDLCCGSGSVLLNVKAKKKIGVDVEVIADLLEFLIKSDESIVEKLKECFDLYGLSNVETKEELKECHARLRNEFNKEKSDMVKLLCLMYISFQKGFRFNRDGEYNMPAGLIDKNGFLNEEKKKEIIDFVRADKGDISIERGSFLEKKELVLSADFVYCDPPYLITDAFYNRHWSRMQEIKLYSLFSERNQLGKPFVISNITENSKEKNDILISWLENEEKNGIRFDFVEKKYGTSGLKKKADNEMKEIVVYNFDKK